MEEFVKYIESLEQRIAALERLVAELQARKPEVVEKVVEVPVEKVVEKIVEVPVEKPAEDPEVEVEFIFDESPIEEEELVVAPEPVAEPEPVVAPEPVAEPEQPIVEPQAAPKFSTQIGAPVDDIRKAISLGDRFLFTRELFDNQGEKMQAVLDVINDMHSLADAMAYLDKHFNWDKESKTYQLFETALKRRFS